MSGSAGGGSGTRCVLAVLLACAVGLVCSLTSAAQNNAPDVDRGLPIAAADATARDRHGHLVLGRGSFSDGEQFIVWVERDRVPIPGTRETEVCFGVEPGPSSCSSPAVAGRAKLDFVIDESGCPDTLVYGAVTRRARRVRVDFANGSSADAHLFAVPDRVRTRRPAAVFAFLTPGKRDITRVVALDARDRRIVSRRDAPRDYRIVC